jgi:hypothetical protein
LLGWRRVAAALGMPRSIAIEWKICFFNVSFADFSILKQLSNLLKPENHHFYEGEVNFGLFYFRLGFLSLQHSHDSVSWLLSNALHVILTDLPHSTLHHPPPFGCCQSLLNSDDVPFCFDLCFWSLSFACRRKFGPDL